jgi:hypothetical protein
MSHQAANSAAQSNSSPNTPGVLIPSFGRHNQHRSMPSSGEALNRRESAAVGTNFYSREGKSDFGALRVLPPRIPSSTRDHASGPIRRPAARRSSASASPPSGLRFPSTTDPPQMQSLALGSRAHSPGVAGSDPSRIREIQRNGEHHHVSEQSHPHRLPRQRRRGSLQR